jgi:hypothetical protein
MKLNGKTLVEWLAKRPASAFPGRGTVEYYRRFQGIEDYLNTKVHPHVTASANAIDGGTLTDHGPEHIKTVIARASELCSFNGDLSAYEAYLLLVAIHLHDVGNLFGRETHELNTEEVIKRLGLLMGEDRVEQKAIYDIAQAHGGNVAGDRDKISRLPRSEPVLGHPVREQTLAAILRFADELADERSRAAGFLMQLAQIDATSEIYHKYAHSLQSVMVDVQGGTVDLHFDMPLADACTTFGKGSSRVYLLDEIYERTMKMHRERTYCMRFLRPNIAIERIDVEIKVYGNDYNRELARLPYRLEESGYPDVLSGGVLKACPSVNELQYGNPLNGRTLHEYLTKNASGGSK